LIFVTDAPVELMAEVPALVLQLEEPETWQNCELE